MANVIWSKKANRKRIALLTNGKKEFGQQVACKLNTRIESYANRLATNPQMGAIEPLLAGRRKTYRSLVVHKHYKLIYLIDEARNVLYIIDLWDTRREPAAQAAHIQH